MSTQITSSNGTYQFNNDVTAEIPVDIERFAAGAEQLALISTSTYTITATGGSSDGVSYPLTPPSWVMSSAFLALLVAQGSVAVA